MNITEFESQVRAAIAVVTADGVNVNLEYPYGSFSVRRGGEIRWDPSEDRVCDAFGALFLVQSENVRALAVFDAEESLGYSCYHGQAVSSFHVVQEFERQIGITDTQRIAFVDGGNWVCPIRTDETEMPWYELGAKFRAEFPVTRETEREWEIRRAKEMLENAGYTVTGPS